MNRRHTKRIHQMISPGSICLAACLFLTSCSGPNENEKAVATIDAAVPSTQVFYRGALLGETPLSISQEMCELHGLPVPNDEIIDDGWGEGVAFGTEDEEEFKLMFLVPADKRNQYLSIETPWGIRTKRSGASYSFGDQPLGLKTEFMPVANTDGVRLELHPLAGEYKPNEEFEIRLTLTSVAPEAIVGYRPELMAFWGTFDTPWRNRSYRRVSIDEKLRTIVPGEPHELRMTLDSPSVAENYSLFVIFNLFRETTGETLVTAVYSESRLLRVRR